MCLNGMNSTMANAQDFLKKNMLFLEVLISYSGSLNMILTHMLV